MNLLISRQVDSTVELLYQATLGEENLHQKDPISIQRLSRIGIGLSWEEPVYYACVVAEKIFWSSLDKSRYSSMFVCLDESQCSDPSSFCSSIISLKDKYLASHIFSQNEPEDFVKRIQSTEGLTFYIKSTSPDRCREIWPSFVSKKTIATFNIESLPSQEECISTIRSYMASSLTDPDSYDTLYDVCLYAPFDLPIPNMRLALERATAPYIQALYLCLSGLSSFRPKKPKEDPDEDSHVHKWQPNLITGY